MSTYYRDMGRTDVKRLARAICTERHLDPDRLVPESGYSDAAMIPYWRKFQDEALNFIAMVKASVPDPPSLEHLSDGMEAPGA